MPSKVARKKTASNAYVKRSDRQRASKAVDKRFRNVQKAKDAKNLKKMAPLLKVAPKTRFRGAFAKCEKLFNDNGEWVELSPEEQARRLEVKRIAKARGIEAIKRMKSKAKGRARPPKLRTREEWIDYVKKSKTF
ncbi:hypothetical protein AAVH_26103 [Aphelenchoides avenae]|nr:hypothetical protein AAVH_26103 [Aphelenchus avenae]